jgi:hypothetical protein
VKFILSILFFLLSFNLFSQQKQSLESEQLLQVTIGSSFHGSGDMKGVMINTGYSKYIRKRIAWSFLLGATVHDKSHPLFYTAPNGENIDGSVRITAGGLQLASHLGYSVIKAKRHQFEIRAGGLVRYQSSSIINDLSILHPGGTGFPIPVLVIRNFDPQRTFTVGASTQLFYNYRISQKISIGLLAGFQLDSFGDVVRHTSFSVGRNF